MLREAALVIGAIFALAFLVDFIFTQFDDPREPRRLRTTIPIIGHVLGFMRHGFDYYITTCRSTDEEIYSIGILGFKVYITNSTRLLGMIQKNKALSLRPFLRFATRMHGNISEEGHALFDGDLVEDFSDRTKEALTPGPYLDQQNLRMGDEAVIEMEELVKSSDMELFQFSKDIITKATGASLFGSTHPFQDPEIVDAMWVWDEHRAGHLFGIDIFGTGYKARTKVFEAFRDYFRNMPEDASMMIRERQRILKEGGLREEDIYKIQSTLSNAYFNTIPTLFWTIFDVFSRPQLLEEIREELMAKAVRKSEDGDSFVLDATALQSECHILLSAYQETQRVRHGQVAFRMVMEDTFLDDRWLLKKGTYLHLPGKPIHMNPKIWGNEVNEYDPYRFVPAATGKYKTKILPSNFQPWGAPPWLCPARQFASTEIMIIMALLALRTHLTPENSVWTPPAEKSVEISTLPHPKKDMSVKVTPRKEGLGKWSVTLGRSKARITLASG